MKKIYHIVLFAVLMGLMTSCEKEVLLDGSESLKRSNALEKEIKSTLHSSADGWILYVSTLNANVRTAMPFIMKFDTLKSTVSMTSMYGKNVSSYFNISATTGMPLLTFSTGSGLSAIYEIGSSNVTDYFFKVLKVQPDTVTIQSYRQGSSGASEGGAIFKMVKNKKPAWISNWQTETLSLYDQDNFFGRLLTVRLTFANDQSFTPVSAAFLDFGPADIAYLRANYPTSTNNTQVTPIALAYLPATGQVNALGFMGVNAIYFDVYAALATTNALYGVVPNTLQGIFKTNYFFVRKINATSISIFAVDKEGNEVITGTISY